MQSFGNTSVGALAQDVQQFEYILGIVIISYELCYFLHFYVHESKYNEQTTNIKTIIPSLQNFSFKYLKLHELMLSYMLEFFLPTSMLSSSVQSEKVLSLVSGVPHYFDLILSCEGLLIFFGLYS